MSRNRWRFGVHFPPLRRRRAPYSHAHMKAPTTPAPSLPAPSASKAVRDLGTDLFQWVAAGVGALVWAGVCALAFWFWPVAAMAQERADPGLKGQVEGLLRQLQLPQAENGAASPLRVEVVLGELDPRLKLAPCDKVRAYMPEGQRMWGRTRVGLRCEQGRAHWNVFWPVTVKVWGQGLVAAAPLRPGTPVRASDLQIAQVDLAAEASPAILRAEDVLGRSVVRGIESGQSLRMDDIKARRWFAAGDPVRLTIRGKGFQVASEGTALSHGDEGRCARVRTDGGRVICGLPTGERQVELSL